MSVDVDHIALAFRPAVDISSANIVRQASLGTELEVGQRVTVPDWFLIVFFTLSSRFHYGIMVFFVLYIH